MVLAACLDTCNVLISPRSLDLVVDGVNGPGSRCATRRTARRRRAAPAPHRVRSGLNVPGISLLSRVDALNGALRPGRRAMTVPSPSSWPYADSRLASHALTVSNWGQKLLKRFNPPWSWGPRWALPAWTSVTPSKTGSTCAGGDALRRTRSPWRCRTAVVLCCAVLAACSGGGGRRPVAAPPSPHPPEPAVTGRFIAQTATEKPAPTPGAWPKTVYGVAVDARRVLWQAAHHRE